MILSNYTELETVVENIGYLQENETDDFITSVYYYLLYNYGDRTVSPIVNSGLTAETIAKIINNKYSKLFEKAKTVNNNDVSLTGYSRTEKTDNQIYGYNSNTGVNDYTTIKTYTNDYENIFDNYIKALAFFNNNAYYSIVVSCIVNELCLQIYESEVD